jgi:hypothetical protein
MHELFNEPVSHALVMQRRMWWLRLMAQLPLHLGTMLWRRIWNMEVKLTAFWTSPLDGGDWLA